MLSVLALAAVWLCAGTPVAAELPDRISAIPEIRYPLAEPGEKESQLFKDYLHAVYSLRSGSGAEDGQLGDLLLRCIDAAPEHDAFLSLLVRWYSRKERGEESLNKLRTLYERHPDSDAVKLVYASALLDKDILSPSVEILEQTVPADLNLRVLRNYALLKVYEHRKQEDKVQELCREMSAVEALAALPQTQWMLLREELRRGEREQAKARAEKLVNNHEFYNYLPDLGKFFKYVAQLEDMELLRLFALRIMVLDKFAVTSRQWQHCNAVMFLCNLALGDTAMLKAQLETVEKIEPLKLRQFTLRQSFSQIDSHCLRLLKEEKLADAMLKVAVSYCEAMYECGAFSGDPSLLRRGIVYLLYGGDAAAAAELIALLPGPEPELKMMLLQLLLQLGRYGEAMEICRDLERPGHLDNVEPSNFYYLFGLAAAGAQQYPLAVEKFQQAYGLAPESAEIANALGYTMADRSVDLARARKLIAAAAEKHPDSAAIQDSLAWVQFRCGEPQAALRSMAQVWRRLKADPLWYESEREISDHLAQILGELGYEHLGAAFAAQP